MSERLTDEQLHETAENARGDVARTMAAELIVLRAYELNRDKEVTALRARVAKLEAALKNIAKQMIKDEMDEQQLKYADYEDAYEIMIKVARDALKDAPQ